MEEKKKHVNYGYIREENRSHYESLINLKDTNGNYALNSSHRKIIEYIGSMSRESGCFSSLRVLNEQSIRVKTTKTLKRHIEYLESIHAISRSIEGKKRVWRIETISEPVLSLKTFRVNKGMSEYNYVNKIKTENISKLKYKDNEMCNQSEMSIYEKTFYDMLNNNINEMTQSTSEPIDTSWFYDEIPNSDASLVLQESNSKSNVFFEHSEAKFATKNDNFDPKQANFAPILYTETEFNSNKKSFQEEEGSLVHSETNIPKNIFNEECKLHQNEVKEKQLAPQADDADGNRLRQHSDGSHQTVSNFFLLKKEKQTATTKPDNQNETNEEWDEPLLGTKIKKGSKTASERKLNAYIENSKGHIVNPLGITNNRPKKLNPKLARDITGNGGVTIPQLYRHLIKLYGAAFGEGLIEQMLPDDKSAVNTYFSKVSQNFIDACKFEPHNRDIAAYFEWILEPQRAARMLGAAKYGEKGMIHFNQLTGLAHIRKFYDTG